MSKLMNPQKNSIWRQLCDLWSMRRYDLILALGCCMIFILSNGCAQAPPKQEPAGMVQFTLPDIPVVITSAPQRAEYLVLHYWDNFDFADTTLIGHTEITEQTFVDYINLFSTTSIEIVEQSIAAMLGKALAGSPAMFDNFTELYEKYLYDPNSPFRQEDYYLAVLRAVIANDRIDDILKVRPRYQLQMALKNRVGDVAADFQYTASNGRSSTLFRTTADYLLLFFNNPDCPDCARVKEYLSTSPAIRSMTNTNNPSSLLIMAIYPDDDLALWRSAHYPSNWLNVRSTSVREMQLYDLKAIPTLYLLDNTKHVLLKDVPVEIVEQYLIQQR